MQDLKTVDNHFAFGENWSNYAQNINDTHIEQAEKGLLRFLKVEELAVKSFLDIGCGSGLHSLAAIRLGARSVRAVDIDPVSVSTTQKILDRFATGFEYTVLTESVFDLSKKNIGSFDIVYSWGVLHHTGAMYEALTEASKTVAPGGIFAFALYRKTPMCGVWRKIKRWYSGASEKKQQKARAVYISLLKFRYVLQGKNFALHKTNYISSRGMSFEHDVHDWMGGYPYESLVPSEAESHMKKLGFSLVRSNVHPSGFGFFGTGCDEFVFLKQTSLQKQID